MSFRDGLYCIFHNFLTQQGNTRFLLQGNKKTFIAKSSQREAAVVFWLKKTL